MGRGRLDLSPNAMRASWSGYERNHFFLNHSAGQFLEFSTISGLDHIADGRTSAFFDYNRDGLQDIVVANSNRPALLLYRNQLGSSKRNFVALRFKGGNQDMAPTNEWSNRDGYGTLVTLFSDKFTIKREHRAGEGFAGQNSQTMLIGIGETTVDSVLVRWPSGKIQKKQNIKVNELLTVHEDPTKSPTGKAFVSTPYRVTTSTQNPSRIERLDKRLSLTSASSSRPNAQLQMYTTMATWCVACQKDLPQISRLQDVFSDAELEVFGVAVDPSDDEKKLADFVRRYKPAYHLLIDLSQGQVSSLQDHFLQTLKLEGIPSTVVTDKAGRVLLTTWGTPTISQVRKLLEEYQSSNL